VIAKALPAVVLLGASALADLSLPDFLRPQLPAAVQRWLYNPRERTERAIAAWEAGDPAAASRHADTALRLAPDDPRVELNAGTAALAAGKEGRAVELLEKAAGKVPPELAPAAHYNLGNAHLARRDYAAAVESYVQALRLAPGHQDAKHNLELALREREKQLLRAGGPRAGSRGDRRGERGGSENAGAEEPGDRERESAASDPGRDRRRQGGEGEEREERLGDPRGGGAGQAGRRPLPRFDEQPDMTAREAAALLAAVENLERQQRREAAAKQAKRKALKGKDW
jgi:Ca-activated chloride channel family protein